MKINEAAKLASKSGMSMKLKSNGMIIHLLPTNTTSAIIESIGNGKHLVYWQPTLDDLISNSWEVTDKFHAVPLPSNAAGPTGTPGILPEDAKRIHYLEKKWYETC